MEIYNYQIFMQKDPMLYSDAEPRAQEIMGVFNKRFGIGSDPVVLLPGKGDPEYIPRSNLSSPSYIFFANGFAASALHEVGHWCIAGPRRRMLLDYGYWYVPDGRDAKQQQDFFSVEAKPQALEWLFSIAAQMPFYVSSDNLSGQSDTTAQMRQSVCLAVKQYLTNGLPVRATLFLSDLMFYFKSSASYAEQVCSIVAGKIEPG